MTSSLDATSTAPENWKYISEGGGSIVFSYNGPNNPEFDGTVIRLRKVSLEIIYSPRGDEDYVAEEPDDPTIAFQKLIISKLVPTTFLPRMDMCRVDRDWLERLAGLAESRRPRDRQNADGIDVHHRKAILSTNLIGNEGIAVEFKPKWGFMPRLTHLSAETKQAKANRCRYCLHSHLREQNGEMTSRGYCPLDLYSGDERRVSHALRKLWNSWITSDGNINNLRLFVNGTRIDPNDLDSLALLSEQLSLHDPMPFMAGENVILVKQFVHTLLPVIMNTAVLPTLSRLQRSLDALDIEGLFALEKAREAQLQFSAMDAFTREPTMDEWEEFVTTYLDHDFQRTLTHENPNPAHLRYYTLAHLLSGTFKDCSIIFHLGKTAGKADSVKIIDLDPKSVLRLRKWAKLDRDVATAFVDTDERRCVEATFDKPRRSR